MDGPEKPGYIAPEQNDRAGRHMNGVRKTRRLAAIVAADVVGFSRLMGANEEGALSAIQACQVELINPLVSSHGGRIVKTMGDGLLLEFGSVVDAIRCAIEIQIGMAGRNDGVDAGSRILYRIGVNVGDVIVSDDDIFGDGVNIAARLEQLSDPGGICISKTALDQVRGKVDITAEDMGKRALKNIEAPVHAFRIRKAENQGSKTSATEGSAQPVSLPEARPSLAILPFRNLSAVPDTDYISDGIGLGIQTLLVQLPNMFFVNACEHEGYRRREVSAAEALAHLPVRFALEGSVQQAGNRVRVTAQVSDLEKGGVIWAETYDRDLTDIFNLQDEIARRIAAALSIELIGGHLARDFTGGLDSPDAWEHFLRGINHFYCMSKPEFIQAIPHFEALAEAHPNSAIGPCYLSVMFFYAANRNWKISEGDALETAQYWARRAIGLEDGNNGLGHAVLGAIALSQRRHKESLDLCRIAVSYRASCPFAHGQLGLTKTFTGDPQSGIKHVRHAMSVRLYDPRPFELNALAIGYRDIGEVDLSINAAQEAARLDPDYLDALVTLCSDLALAGNETEAANIAVEIKEKSPEFSVGAYLDRLPYDDPAAQEQIRGALNASGLR